MPVGDDTIASTDLNELLNAILNELLKRHSSGHSKSKAPNPCERACCTYFLASNRCVVLLTVFRKQRQNERNEVHRARLAMSRCIIKEHTADEDD
jgi:hypothetical protein